MCARASQGRSAHPQCIPTLSCQPGQECASPHSRYLHRPASRRSSPDPLLSLSSTPHWHYGRSWQHLPLPEPVSPHGLLQCLALMQPRGAGHGAAIVTAHCHPSRTALQPTRWASLAPSRTTPAIVGEGGGVHTRIPPHRGGGTMPVHTHRTIPLDGMLTVCSQCHAPRKVRCRR